MFVTFEGPEGSGKSTVLKEIARRLEAEGIAVVTTREPGGSPVGEEVRKVLLHGQELEPIAELFLFLADRAQHGAAVIRPALAKGHYVLCDRYADSTVVYQGHARGLDKERLRSLNDMATGGLRPDLTILLDLEPEIGLSRVRDRDRLDDEPIEFHRRVRDGFLCEAERQPERWRVIDASQPLADVVEQCWNALADVRSKHG